MFLPKILFIVLYFKFNLNSGV